MLVHLSATMTPTAMGEERFYILFIHIIFVFLIDAPFAQELYLLHTVALISTNVLHIYITNNFHCNDIISIWSRLTISVLLINLVQADHFDTTYQVCPGSPFRYYLSSWSRLTISILLINFVQAHHFDTTTYRLSKQIAHASSF